MFSAKPGLTDLHWVQASAHEMQKPELFIKLPATRSPNSPL
jgi:hypothetical protein